jgi:SAM-dependent methyltransferase
LSGPSEHAAGDSGLAPFTPERPSRGADPDREEGGRLESIGDYWSLRAANYSESVLEDLRSDGWKRWMAAIEAHRPPGTLKVLDVGTGPGFFPIVMGREGHQVTAVDYSQAMLEAARDNCLRFGASASFLRMDAQRLEFPDGTFDLVLSRNLLWDLERPRQAYREWIRVLRPGGRLIVFDGNHYLHLYDREYRELERAKDRTRYLAGVDTDIIRDIAFELPLSRERRPQWDVNTLTELGARLVLADTRGMEVHHRRVGSEEIAMPFSFVVVAER